MANLSVFDVAGQSLRLRAAALAAFGQTDDVTPGLWERVLDVPVEAWDLFVETEQYVAPLAGSLQRAGVIGSLPNGAATVLSKHRRRESVRALRARAQLEEIGAAAKERGWSIIVLKGGRAVLEDVSAACPLFDLDLLVPPEQLNEFMTWLDSRQSSVSDWRPPKHHLEPRYTDRALPVEVHRTIHTDGSPVSDDQWEGAVRLGDGFLGLSPVEHTWHMLHHATVSHVNRRGRLRDLELLSQALKQCSAADRQELQNRPSMESFADPLREFLQMAEQAAAGEQVMDRFGLLAFTRYVTYWTVRRSSWRGLTVRATTEWVFAMQSGWEGCKLMWQRGTDRRSPRPIVRSISGAVDRVSPRLGALVERLARRAYRAVLAVLAWAAALWIRWAWRRATRPDVCVQHRAAPLEK